MAAQHRGSGSVRCSNYWGVHCPASASNGYKTRWPPLFRTDQPVAIYLCAGNSQSSTRQREFKPQPRVFTTGSSHAAWWRYPSNKVNDGELVLGGAESREPSASRSSTSSSDELLLVIQVATATNSAHNWQRKRSSWGYHRNYNTVRQRCQGTFRVELARLSERVRWAAMAVKAVLLTGCSGFATRVAEHPRGCPEGC
jgi:hypothetical protein